MKSRVVLGYSGLDGSAEYLGRRHDLTQAERRYFQGMDAAAALFIDGRLVAAVQEERFSGTKFDHRFPLEAMTWCMRFTGISETDVDAVAHGFDFGPYRRMFAATEAGADRFRSVYAPDVQQALLSRHFPLLAKKVTVQSVRHHHAHAYSAVHGSGYDECLAVVMDGMGEMESISVYRWTRAGGLEQLASYDYRSSLGLFYSLVTTHLGFQPNSDEYRVMALAALGDPQRYASVMAAAVQLLPRGRLRVRMLDSAVDDPHREQYRRGRVWLAEQTFPARESSDALADAAADLAASAQQRLEHAIAHVLTFWMAETGLTRIAMAGGVALNCVAIGRSFDWGVSQLYVQPAAGDEGTALGAGLAVMDQANAEVLPAMPYLGPEIHAVPGAADLRRDPWRALVRDAAANLERGAIVGWAQGRLEFGPRALGNRSILADPRRASTRERVNSAVKFREGFRPLAPVVLAERADEYFDLPAGATTSHMTAAFHVRPQKRDAVPAVVHTDGTARVQVVDRAHAPLLAALLDEFDRVAGVPVLVNTSLNVKGQPMAALISDAVWTFENSAMDVLYAGDRVLAKDDSRGHDTGGPG